MKPNTSDLSVGWNIKSFTECLEKEASSNKLKIPQKEFKDEGKYAIVDQGVNFVAGYTDNSEKVYWGDLPVIIFGDHTRNFKYVDFPFALGADGTKILVPKKDILIPKYFYYFLRGLRIESHGYSRHFKFLKGKRIVIPPLKTQKEIVAILEKAEQLKEMRKEADMLTGEYLKSVFLEMFGDPVTNPKEWDMVNLGKLVKSSLNGFGRRKQEELEKTPIVLRIKDIQKGYINTSQPRRISMSYEEYQKYQLKRNDFLYVRVNGSIELVGESAVVPEIKDEITFSDHIVRLRFYEDKVCSIFIHYLSQTAYFRQNLLKQVVTTAGQNSIGFGRLSKIKIYLPPISVQLNFAQIVEKVEAVRQNQNHTKKQIDNLFNVLMQKEFRGELAC